MEMLKDLVTFSGGDWKFLLYTTGFLLSDSLKRTSLGTAKHNAL